MYRQVHHAFGLGWASHELGVHGPERVRDGWTGLAPVWLAKKIVGEKYYYFAERVRLINSSEQSLGFSVPFLGCTGLHPRPVDRSNSDPTSHAG